MEAHCSYCDNTEHLDSCRRCMKPVCPTHRWGTGSLSDGYFCLGTKSEECGAGSDGFTQVFGVPKRRSLTIYQLINRMHPALFFPLFAAIWFGVFTLVKFICTKLGY